MATQASIERRKFRKQLEKRIKANSSPGVSKGAIKQLAFRRTQQAVKQFEETQRATIEAKQHGETGTAV